MASVVDGFISQGELNATGVRAVTGWPGNLHEMGVGWAGMGAISPTVSVPIHLVDGYG